MDLGRLQLDRIVRDLTTLDHGATVPLVSRELPALAARERRIVVTDRFGSMRSKNTAFLSSPKAALAPEVAQRFRKRLKADRDP